MSEGILEDRRKSFEAAFFQEQDQRLIDQLREKREAEAQREALARICGVSDPSFLDSLIGLGVNAESFVALCVAPLVAVAWADTHMAATERRAVLEEAENMGVEAGSPAHELLTHWVERRPSHTLLEEWEQYVQLLCTQLGEEDRRAFQADVMSRAQKIATAAGGVLGLGPKTSKEEREVLERLEAAFQTS